MKKVLSAILVIANICAASALGWALCSPGHASTGLRISDLTYGAIDIDNDGKYTLGDDYVVEFLWQNARHHLTAALETAVVNPDGGVNLSSYILSISADSVNAATSE